MRTIVDDGAQITTLTGKQLVEEFNERAAALQALADASAKANASLGAPPVPVIAGIHKRIFDAASQPGALDMHSWHKCKKTHCRAGWAVTLAGEEGRKLEAFYNTELAAMLIYSASGYLINPERFHDDNDSAMEDMRRLAEQGA